MDKSNFQFKDPVLTKLDYNINVGLSKKEYTQFEGITTKVKVDDTTKDDFKAKVALNLKMGTDSTPFTLEMEMQSDFIWNNSFKNTEIDLLLKQNAPALLLSYMRPIISEITGYGFNSFMLPFIDFSKES